MTVQAHAVASFNELAAYFRQRQADQDGDRWYGGSCSSYERTFRGLMSSSSSGLG